MPRLFAPVPDEDGGGDDGDDSRRDPCVFCLTGAVAGPPLITEALRIYRDFGAMLHGDPFPEQLCGWAIACFLFLFAVGFVVALTYVGARLACWAASQ